MKKYVLALSAIASSAIAGGSMGGGTPPALQDLYQELLLNTTIEGGLFHKTGDIGLLTRVKLQPQILVGPEVSVASGDILGLSEQEFALLRDRSKPLDVVNIEGAAASYNIEAGETLNSLILTDRRNSAREDVRK